MSARRLHIFLRDAARTEIGRIEIRQVGTSAEIEIVNFDSTGLQRAKVLLTPEGAIHLMPAAGRKVIVEGDLDVYGTYLNRGTPYP